VMFDVGRSVWLRGERFGGPRFVGSRVDRVVVHYPGGRESWVPPRDVGGFVLGMHRDWLRRKGFSLGYNAIVVDSVGHPDDGRVFEVRGFDFRSAANAGVNEVSFAVQFLQGSGRFPSDRAVESMRRLVVGLEGRLGRRLDIVGHRGSGGSTRTLCPGAGLERALRENVFRGGPVPVPVPVVRGVDVINLVQPFRNSDTRVFGGAGVEVRNHRFGLDPKRVPRDAVAVALNFAVVSPAGDGFLTVWPKGSRPESSVVNFRRGQTTSGSVVVGVDDLHFMVYASQRCHLVVDVTGFWTP